MMRRNRRRTFLTIATMMSGIKPPPAPTNLAITGASGGTVADLTPEATWGAAAGAVTYTLQYGTASDFTGATEVTGIATTSYTHPSDLLNFNRYYWRVAPVGPGGQGPWSDTVSVITSVFAASLGSELLTNADFASGTTGWTVGNTGTSSITETAADGTAGTGALTFQGDATASDYPRLSQNVPNVAGWYERALEVSARAAAAYILVEFSIASNTSGVMDCVGLAYYASSPNYYVRSVQPNKTFTIDSASMKKIALGGLVGSVADGTFDLHFSAPSAVSQTMVGFMYRSTDEANGYIAYLLRNSTNTAWDVAIQKIVAGTRSSLASAAGLTTLNALRVVTSGNDHSLWTSEDDGENWTQRDTTKTDAAFASETGVRPIYTSNAVPSWMLVPPGNP